MPSLQMRWSNTSDVRFIFRSWFKSWRAAAERGECTLPVSEDAMRSLERSEARLKRSEAARDKTAVVHEQRLQHKLRIQELDRYIRGQMLTIPAVVAYEDDAPGFVVGWAHATPETLNFVYVRQSYRGNQVGCRLLGSVGERRCATLTKAGIRLLKRFNSAKMGGHGASQRSLG
jgi:hypothetical protein